MDRAFGNLEESVYDVLVVGGGAFGACAAWDAALRGLSVALVERHDFCSGVSANSFKVVHGGIRYLQHADLIRLRVSCAERTAWLRIAPHLVSPLPIAIPTYGHGREGKLFLGAGMLLYDLLTCDRNRGFRDEARKVPMTRLLSVDELGELFPGLPTETSTGAAVFCDGQIYNPTRLVWSLVRSAADNGAVVVNYAEATRLTRSGTTVTGAEVRDNVTGDVAHVRANAVLWAAGPWVPWLAEAEGLAGGREGSFSRDACFLVRRRFPHAHGVAVQGGTRDPDALVSRSARHLFLLPWREYTLCGVWHAVWPTHPDTVQVEAQDLEQFLDEINTAFPSLDLGPDEVTTWNAGLVPFGENDPDAKNLSYGKRSRIVDHAETDGARNLVSLVGIRYTMARHDAARAVDLLCRKLGRRAVRARTAGTPVHGGSFETFERLVREVRQAAPASVSDAAVEALAHNHGSAYRAVLSMAEHEAALAQALSGSTTLKAEVVNAVRHEMALSLADIVFRRTDLATGGHPGTEALGEAAALAAGELGWGAERVGAEIAGVEQRFALGTSPAAVPAMIGSTSAKTTEQVR